MLVVAAIVVVFIIKITIIIIIITIIDVTLPGKQLWYTHQCFLELKAPRLCSHSNRVC